MKITKKKLRRMIAEAMPSGGVPDVVGATTGVPGGNIQNLVDEYKEWAVDYMGTPSGANSSSVLATFLVDKGLDQGPMADSIMKDMAREMRFDIVDVRSAVRRSREEFDAGGVLSDQESHARGFKEAKLRFTKNQIEKMIQEELMIEIAPSSKFAATAEEEAKKINSQTGAGYVTDQAFWEKQGIVTGEDLAISVLNQTYSDFYKEVHGFRPRQPAFTSVEEAQTAIDELDDYYMSMAEQDELDVARQAEIEKDRQELETLMPGEFDFQDLPKHAGMGRRAEGAMNLSKERLAEIILEEVVRHSQKS